MKETPLERYYRLKRENPETLLKYKDNFKKKHPNYNAEYWAKRKQKFVDNKIKEVEEKKLLRSEAYKKIAEGPKRPLVKGFCKTCGIEFFGRPNKKFCKPSHHASAKEAKRLRKRIMQGRHKPRPKWQDTKSLVEFYRKCPPGMVVDHIIPLNHPEVSGMHCVSNLQYLSNSDNMKKSNKFDGTNNNDTWKL